MGQQDLGYRSLFSFPRMVEELVREFVAEPWVEKLDFATLKRVNASYVSTELKGREGDLLWKLHLRGGAPVYVYLLIEHQSRVDRFMAVRLMAYMSLLYQDLLKEGELTPEGRLPLVIPLVLYNGEAEWWAPRELSELIERVDEAADAYMPRLRYRVIDESRFALEDLERRKSVAAQVFWLEQNRDPKTLGQGTGRLVPLLSGPEDGPLRQAVLIWIERVLMPGRRRHEPIPEALGLEEFRAMLEKRVEEWNRELREEGRLLGLKEGRKEGLQKGEATLLLRLLKRKFGPIDPETRKRVHSADTKRLLAWGERVLTAERLEDVFES
ncbi:MAG TPA: Rpn family recombination-promoting nuclease/putative transposase [Thermoanaerobaculia bacterium]|nr:Rpn family recombination-promoting nuclease/putative transposase [Thermoanaerobaculia bacterium]